MIEKELEFQDALKATAEVYPTSAVADLITHFTPAVVAKFLEIYAGQHIVFPTVNTIWRCYRDRVIYTALSLKNARETRKRLAIYFGLNTVAVSGIFARVKDSKRRKKELSPELMKTITKRAYLSERRSASNDIKEILSK